MNVELVNSYTMKTMKNVIGLGLLSCLVAIGLCGCGKSDPEVYKGVVVEKSMTEHKRVFPFPYTELPKYYIKLRPLREDGLIKYEYRTIQVSQYDVMMCEVGDTIQFVE